MDGALMAIGTSRTRPLPAHDIEEIVRSEARGLLGDWFLKALSVVTYLSVPGLVLLAALVASGGTYAVLAAAIITSALGLLLVAHRPWRHAARRAEARKATREQEQVKWQERIWRRPERRLF
ncbi:hypothetical protein OIE62_18815 [Streptomyces scopuliridis]|uniref:Uncharacterized protein n=1 Tax=Streptomyces scopuliridis TaxID=452529 RepID=A0ACD4ZM44_9ACTN|nr:hypothetical protein [Streptomyces scopuliridis]WSB35200.1 hypothetical protein OG949_21640 [Streptomyces scopuliridis]WSB99443.1 hypothetical protein OG835_22135 [Streptomyces scopuliridis]WSC06856.1 hypothetical protein OIE62_18815 [Streptomyces scopuliridis]